RLSVAVSAIALSRVAAGAGPIGQRLAEAPGRRLFGAGVLLILALTMATALVCSRSRMGIASMVLALSSVAAILVWRGRGRNFAAAAIIVAGATLLIFGQGDAAAPIAERFVGVIGEF